MLHSLRTQLRDVVDLQMPVKKLQGTPWLPLSQAAARLLAEDYAGFVQIAAQHTEVQHAKAQHAWSQAQAAKSQVRCGIHNQPACRQFIVAAEHADLRCASLRLAQLELAWPMLAEKRWRKRHLLVQLS